MYRPHVMTPMRSPACRHTLAGNVRELKNAIIERADPSLRREAASITVADPPGRSAAAASRRGAGHPGRRRPLR